MINVHRSRSRELRCSWYRPQHIHQWRSRSVSQRLQWYSKYIHRWAGLELPQRDVDTRTCMRESKTISPDSFQGLIAFGKTPHSQRNRSLPPSAVFAGLA